MSTEDSSKAAAYHEFERLVVQADHLDIEVRWAETDDFGLIMVRCPKPEGRTFVFQLTCDDYPRIAPLLRFLNPEAWTNLELQSDAAREHWPTGSSMAERGKPFPVPCIRGHRDYYEGGWHDGWSKPLIEADTIYQTVVQIRNAIFSVWS